MNVDKSHEPGAFWLTGSQVFKLILVLMKRKTYNTGEVMLKTNDKGASSCKNMTLLIPLIWKY